MSLLRRQVFALINNSLKYNSRLSLTQTKTSAVIYLPNVCFCRAHYSSDPKTPLSQLFGKETKPKAPQDEDEEAKRTRESSWRTMKYTLIGFGVTITCLGLYLIIELGKPRRYDNGTIMKDEYSHMPKWKQYIYRTLSELDYYKRLIKEPSRDKLLPDVVKYPYYQPPYTLVLELTDVLVHPDWTYKTGWRFKKRPGIDHFLETLNGLYEIVIYTAEQGMTVFPIMEILDPNNIVAYKLVRDATHFTDGHHVKNLDKLNRDLKKVIVIDWNTESVKFHPENLFHLNRWNGEDDITLSDLAAFLRTIAESEIHDVREVLKLYSTFDNPLDVYKERYKRLRDQLDAENVARLAQTPSGIKRWSPTFLQKLF